MSTLFTRLMGLPYNARIKEVIELGRKSRQEAAVAKGLSELSLGDACARRLALFSCFGSQDGAPVVRAVSDPSRLVRGLALRMVPRVCDDEQALEAILIAHQRRQHVSILRTLHHKKRFAPIDRFLEKLEASKALDLQDVIVFGSLPTIQRLIDKAFALPSDLFWQRLLRRHPDLLIDYLIKTIAASSEIPDQRFRYLLNRVLYPLSERRPLQTLALIEQIYRSKIPEGRELLQSLIPAYPRECFALIRRLGISFNSFSFFKVELKLSMEELAFLVKEYRGCLQEPQNWFFLLKPPKTAEAYQAWLKEWFQKNPQIIQAWLEGQTKAPLWGAWLFQFLPEEPKEVRDTAYQVWSTAARDRFGIIQALTLQILPWDLREREARRHITEVKKLDTQPILRFQYYPLLPWVEAKGHFTPWLSHPEPEIRIQALQPFLLAFRNRVAAGLAAESDIQECLTLIQQRRYEQDPVRNVMLDSLASWPHTAWKKEHLPLLGEICQAALDAADLSGSTANHLNQLLIRLFAVDPPRVVEWCLNFLQTRGMFNPSFGIYAEAEVEKIAPALLTLSTKLIARSQHYVVVSLAQSLGKTLPKAPALAPLLLMIAKQTPNIAPLSLLYSYFRSVFDGNVRQIIEPCKPAEKNNLVLDLLRRCPKQEPTGPLYELVIEQLFAPKQHKNAYQFLALLHLNLPDKTTGLLPRMKTDFKKHFEEIFVSFIAHSHSAMKQDTFADCAQEIIQTTEHIGYVTSLLMILEAQRKERFQALVPKLLSSDPTYIFAAPISRYLDRERQDLLPAYTGEKSFQGKFEAFSKDWVFPEQRWAYTWPPLAQERMAKRLDTVSAEEERPIPEVRRYLSRRVLLPYASSAGVEAFANDKRSAVKETTIRALSRLDAGQAIPTLLECLADDRARFAIYGFRKAIVELPAVAALDLLRKTPLQKVTVAKELMRLLGEMRSEEAFQYLLSLSDPKLHRDVRVAQLRSLWEHLERPEPWAVFEQAVADPDWILAAKVAELPLGRLSAASEKKMCALMAKLLQRPEPEARVELFAKVKALPLADQERKIFSECLSHFTSRHSDEFRAALSAVFYRARSQDVTAVVRRFQDLLPHRRQLLAAFEILLGSLHGEVQRQIGRGLLEVLLLAPTLIPEAIKLSSYVSTPDELQAQLFTLAEKKLLHADAMIEAHSALSKISASADNEKKFRKHAAPEIRRLGLELLRRASSHGHGWIKARREALEEYQRDLSPLVAGAALKIFPVEE